MTISGIYKNRFSGLLALIAVGVVVIMYGIKPVSMTTNITTGANIQHYQPNPTRTPDPQILEFFKGEDYVVGGMGPCGKNRIYLKSNPTAGPICVLFEEAIKMYENLANIR